MTLPAEFRFEGTEVQVHRDPNCGVLELRDALLQEPGLREELDGLFEGLHHTSHPEPVDVP